MAEHTKRRPDLTPIPAAQNQILAAFSPLGAEDVPVGEAAGRVLAAEISAPIDLPAFDGSSMDGFALLASDTLGASLTSPVVLKVVADIPAGHHFKGGLEPGQAARIMTGAPLPQGADAVVPVEDTDYGVRAIGTQAPAQVEVYRPVERGDYVRPRGQDVSQGETVLTPKRRLRPQDVGVLAMLGFEAVPVSQRPKVGLMAPGDELLPLGAPLTPGKIFDSNSYMLEALIAGVGGAVVNLGIVPDQMEVVRTGLDRAVGEGVDLLLSTGGVSVGAFDFVRAVLEQEGELDLWRVNMRPGKPLAFGRYRGVPYLGLPGNPVSAYVGFQVFVQPVLRKLQGLSRPTPETRRVKLLERVESDGRESYLRAVVTFEGGRWVARLTGHQGSGNLYSLVQANALLMIPAGVTLLEQGAEADAWML
jgi:molybdopterin molybdotransferase